MVYKVALDGDWSADYAWLDGSVPASGRSLKVTIAPGVTSYQTLEGPAQNGTPTPFVAGTVAFVAGYAAASTFVVTSIGSMNLGSLYGGRPGNHNSVVVGSSTFLGHQSAVLHVEHDARNVHFTQTGADNPGSATVNSTVVIDGRFDGSTFAFTGVGGFSTLELQQPPIRFLKNELDFTAFSGPGPAGTGSFGEKLELGSLQFDRASFLALPGCGGNTGGSVVLFNHNHPVYTLSDVSVIGYAGRRRRSFLGRPGYHDPPALPAIQHVTIASNFTSLKSRFVTGED